MLSQAERPFGPGAFQFASPARLFDHAIEAPVRQTKGQRRLEPISEPSPRSIAEPCGKSGPDPRGPRTKFRAPMI